MKKILILSAILLNSLSLMALDGLKLVGGATAMGWPGDPALENAGFVLTPDENGNFIYEGMLYRGNSHDGEFKFMVKENEEFGGWGSKQLHPEKATEIGIDNVSTPANFDGTDDRKWTVTVTGWYRISVTDTTDGITVDTEFIKNPFRIVGGAYKGWSTGPDNILALTYSHNDDNGTVYAAECVLNHAESEDKDGSAFKLIASDYSWMPCVCAKNEPFAEIGAFKPFEGEAYLRTAETEDQPDFKWYIVNSGLYKVSLTVNGNAEYKLSADYVPSLTVMTGDKEIECKSEKGEESVIFNITFEANDSYALRLSGALDADGYGWFLVPALAADEPSTLENSDTSLPAKFKTEWCTLDKARQTVDSGKYTLKADLSDWNNPTVQVESSITTGIAHIESDATEPVEFYTVQGVKVDHALTPGIYIVRSGNNVSKKVIK